MVTIVLVVVQSLTRIWLFASQWTTAHQASLSFTLSCSFLKLMSIELMMPSNHLILCHPLLLLPSVVSASGSFPVSWPFASGGQSIGASASPSVFPMNIQAWFPLWLIGLISLQFKKFSSLLQCHNLKVSFLRYSTFFMVQLSHPDMTTGKTITLTMTDLCRQSDVSAF